MVLTRLSPRGLLRKLDAAGAVGVITDYPQPHLPDATAWIKFGWGHIPRSEDPARLVGLVLSENQGAALRRLIGLHGVVRAHVKVDVRKYVGHHDLVSARVMGRDDPQDEVWTLAHSAEPGAVDNASGVSVCLEMARILESLIAAGRLSRPRRTIRFLNAYECYGFFHYMEQVSRLETPLAGVNLDMLGMKPDVCNGRLSWRATIPMSAGFVDCIGEAVLRATLPHIASGYTLHTGPFVSTADTLAGDPKYGFPCPWLTTHYRDEGVYHAYHSSADTRELLSPEGLAVCAAGTAAYLYYLADMGSEQAVEMAQTETARTLDILRRGVKDAASGLLPSAGQTKQKPPDTPQDGAEPLSLEEIDYLREAHTVSVDRLQRWLWGGDRRALMAVFDTCKKTVSDTARAKRKKTRASSLEPIPYRTAFLSPMPANVPTDIAHRLSASGLADWAVFWADGRRTISDIATELSCEYQRPVETEQVEKYLRGLADLGYVKMIQPERMITKDRLIADLRRLGLCPGMDVMVHSSLSVLGPVLGGAETVVDALLEAAGPSGTVLMPSFHHRVAQVFNPMTTPTINGAIPDVFWRRSEAVRSDHPTHAVAAIGPRAEWYCENHAETGIWSPESPIGKLIHHDGYLLALGVTHHTTTTYHVAEVSIPCGCIDPFGNMHKIVGNDGVVREVKSLAFRAGECPVPPVRLHDTLRATGQERYGRIGDTEASLVKGIDLWNTRRAHLKDVCPSCTVRPNYAKAVGR